MSNEENKPEVTQPSPETKPEKKSTRQQLGSVEIHPKVEIVEEEGDGKDFGRTPKGALFGSNNTYDELEDFWRREFERVSKLQPARRKLTKEEAEELGMVQYQYGEEEGEFIIATETEAETLLSLQMSIRPISTNRNDKMLFGLDDKATNLPLVSAENRPVLIMSPKPNAAAQSPVARVKAKLGLAVNRWVPLWTSGFRVLIEGPSVIRQLNLETQLINEKIESVTNTFGYTLSSEGIYRDRVLIDFILESIIQSTSGSVDKETLAKNIALPDYDILLLGLASTMHPGGYPMERLIFRDTPEGVQGNRVRRKLNIWRMKVVRMGLLSDQHKENVGKTGGTIPEEEIRKHRESIREDLPRYVELAEGVYAKLHIPTLDEYIRIGLSARTLMEESVTKVMRDSEDPDVRLNYIARMSTLTRIRYLSHWVEGIYSRNEVDSEIVPEVVRVRGKNATEESVYNADKDIDDILVNLVANDLVADKLVEEIEKFVNGVRISYAVLTREPNTQIGPGEHPMVVTVNPASIFFDLLRHKILMAGA